MSKRSININNAISNHPANKGLIGWWIGLPTRIGGPKYWDISNYKNHAILQSYSPPSGPQNVLDGTNTRFGAIKADGVDTHGAEVSIANIPTFNVSNPLTVSLWLQNFTAEQAHCVALCDNSYNGLGVTTRTPQNNSNGSYLVYGANPLPSSNSTGKWHILYTQDSTKNYLYLNGKLWQSDVVSSYPRGNVNITRLWFAKNTYLNGSQSLASGDILGDIRIKYCTTSAAEAAFTYQQRIQAYPDLLSYRSFVSFAKPASVTTSAKNIYISSFNF